MSSHISYVRQKHFYYIIDYANSELDLAVMKI